MTKRIVLAGGGHAHLAVLAEWLKRPCDQEDRVLIMPSERSAYSGMLPGWMAGIYAEEEMFIPVAQLARKAGARVVTALVTALDADTQTLQMSNGESLGFDLLSLATGGEVPSDGFAMLEAKLLTVRPVERFVQDWAQFVADAPQLRSPHVAIVGGGAGGVELALAAHARLSQIADSFRISLITPKSDFLTGHASSVRRRVLAAMRERRINLHWSWAKAEDGLIALEDGRKIAADAVIAATGSQAQVWLAASGLACDPQGYVLVRPTLQSASHPNIFAAGDIAQRTDRPLARSGVHAVKSGPVLANNARQLAHPASEPVSLKSYDPRHTTLYLMSTGDRRAILSWGKFSAEGRAVWWLKERIDRQFVEHFSRLAQ